ncbi:Zip domain containing protein [Trichuris trichiura]|uniref:Zip domain containing protein n=1 Tax=Trichuris trichiura TaxID=36087 RepID=A0A077ZDF8_TRITR|nr:Zip domain containing protein [Trichuris trichiura]
MYRLLFSVPILGLFEAKVVRETALERPGILLRVLLIRSQLPLKYWFFFRLMLKSFDPITQALLGSLFTWAVTALGSAFVFLLKPTSQRILGMLKKAEIAVRLRSVLLIDASLGFSAGVMTAASFWSLLDPAISIGHHLYEKYGYIMVLSGFLAGAGFLRFFDSIFGTETPVSVLASTNSRGTIPKELSTSKYHTTSGAEGELRKRTQTVFCSDDNQIDSVLCLRMVTATSWRRIFLLVVAITVHNIPEGLAVGVGFGAVGTSTGYTFEKARNLAIGIGLQNFPEGLAVSLPLAAFGYSKWSSFMYGQLSGMVEPLAALAGAVGVTAMHALLPFSLSFAAGAMIYVVFDDVVPEAQSRGNNQIAIWCLIAGFSIMMSMDVLLYMPQLSCRLACTFYKNFPKSYIERTKKTIPKKVFGNRFGAPNIVEYERKPEDYVYDELRPWQHEAQMRQDEYDNFRKLKQFWKIPKVNVEPIPDDQWWIFRGDRVEVLVGKDKGKQGIVNYIVRERNWCFVEGLNAVRLFFFLENMPRIIDDGKVMFCEVVLLQVFETVGAIKRRGFKGTMIKRERPLSVIGEVALVDPIDFRPTKIEWRWNEKGERVRQGVRTGSLIPIPTRSLETFEYVTPETYQECEKDTPAADVKDHTFVPVMKTFEQDIMEQENIKGDLESPNTYWY